MTHALRLERETEDHGPAGWLIPWVHVGYKVGMPVIFSFALLWVGWFLVTAHQRFLTDTVATNLAIAEAVKSLADANRQQQILLHEIHQAQGVQSREMRETRDVLETIRDELKEAN